MKHEYRSPTRSFGGGANELLMYTKSESFAVSFCDFSSSRRMNVMRCENECDFFTLTFVFFSLGALPTAVRMISILSSSSSTN